MPTARTPSQKRRPVPATPSAMPKRSNWSPTAAPNSAWPKCRSWKRNKLTSWWKNRCRKATVFCYVCVCKWKFVFPRMPNNHRRGGVSPTAVTTSHRCFSGGETPPYDLRPNALNIHLSLQSHIPQSDRTKAKTATCTKTGGTVFFEFCGFLLQLFFR